MKNKMNILGIDTSTRYASVSLLNEEEKRFYFSWHSNQNHGSELLPNINRLLVDAKIKMKDISHITVCLGPGGFSALRTGIATTIGISMGNNSTTYGINTHIIESSPYINNYDNDIVSMIPAGKSIYSWARLNKDQPNKIIAENIDDLETISKFDSNVLFCGESSVDLNGIINTDRILTKSFPTRDPNIILDISLDVVKNKKYFDLDELKPIYSRKPSISKPKYK